MLRLLRIRDVKCVTSDECQYGLLTPVTQGNMVPAKKQTKWASSSPQMLDRLNKRCTKDHRHRHLVGGRARNAAFYTPELITRGMRDTEDAEHNEPEHCSALNVAMRKAGLMHDQPAHSLAAAFKEADLGHMKARRHIQLNLLDGRVVNLDSENHFKPAYKDEYTTEALTTEGAKEAIHDELSYVCDKVFRGVYLEDVQSDPDGKTIGCRWVNCNKGDAETPDVRCRLVAQEVNLGGDGDDNLCPATPPPLEAKRLLFRQWATEKVRGGKKSKLSFVDTQKACFNVNSTRNLYIRLPLELCLPKNVLGKLARCMYGTRDAGAIWESCDVDCLVGMGFT